MIYFKQKEAMEFGKDECGEWKSVAKDNDAMSIAVLAVTTTLTMMVDLCVLKSSKGVCESERGCDDQDNEDDDDDDCKTQE